MDDRKQFLIHMYDQMFNDIDTHILVVWQSIGVLVGSLALFALVAKNALPLDLATAAIVLLCCWLIAHLYDAAYWYNRNLVIIANIERQFLSASDLKDVHYYFGEHRKKSAMLTHLRIQYWLGVGIAGLVLAYHFYTRLLRDHRYFVDHPNAVAIRMFLPYVVVVGGIWWLWNFRDKQIRKYVEFKTNSPGIAVDTTGVQYKLGHPIDSQDVVDPRTRLDRWCALVARIEGRK